MAFLKTLFEKASASIQEVTSKIPNDNTDTFCRTPAMHSCIRKGILPPNFLTRSIDNVIEYVAQLTEYVDNLKDESALQEMNARFIANEVDYEL